MTLDPLAVEADKIANQRAYELDRLIQVLRPRTLRRVLEVGTENGGSLWLWAQLAADDAELMAVDAEWQSTAFTSLMGRFPWPARAQQRLKLWKGDSQSIDTITAVHEWATSPVDFLFIDADHSRDGVLADWSNYSPLVADGGIAAFHDTANQARDGWLAVKDCASYGLGFRTKEFVDPDDHGCGIGVVYL